MIRHQQDLYLLLEPKVVRLEIYAYTPKYLLNIWQI